MYPGSSPGAILVAGVVVGRFEFESRRSEDGDEDDDDDVDQIQRRLESVWGKAAAMTTARRQTYRRRGGGVLAMVGAWIVCKSLGRGDESNECSSVSSVIFQKASNK